MNLVWHIIKKDLRALRWPLVLWTLLIVAKLGVGVILLMADGSGDKEWFVQMAVWARLLAALEGVSFVLAAALIQQDLLVGTTEFWMTRPISGARLLSAKLLGLGLVFGLLPLLVTLPWWLWCGYGLPEMGWAVLETVIIQAAFVLLGALWAVVTDGYARFLMWTLVLLVAVVAITAMISWYVTRIQPGPGAGVIGTRIWVAMVLAVGAIVVVIFHQFLTRKTWRSGAIIGATAGLIIATGLWWPWDWNPYGRWNDYLVRQLVHSKPQSPEPVGLKFALESVQLTPPPRNHPGRPTAALVKFKAQGMAENQGLMASFITAGLHWSDGTTEHLRSNWASNSGVTVMNRRNALGLPVREGDEPQYFHTTFHLAPAIAARLQAEQPEITLKALMQIMHFGPAAKAPLQPGSRMLAGTCSTRIARVEREDRHVSVTVIRSYPDFWVNNNYGYFQNYGPAYSQYRLINRDRNEVGDESPKWDGQTRVSSVVINHRETSYQAPKSVGTGKQAQEDWLKNAGLIKDSYTLQGRFTHELRADRFPVTTRQP